MHELSVCQSILQQVGRIAVEHRARSVSVIRLQIGPLSGVESDLLQQAFPIASVGSVAESAELIIEAAPVRVHCTLCGADSDARPNRLLCAACGTWKTRLLSGDELLLVSIEMSRPETAPSAREDTVHV